MLTLSQHSGGFFNRLSAEIVQPRAVVPEILSFDSIRKGQLEKFGRSRSIAQKKYRQFVREGRESRPWNDLTGQIYLGSDKFIVRHSGGDQEIKEIPRAIRRPTRPRLDQLFARKKATAILQAYREYGYRLHEIADHLGVHYATVSRRLRKIEQHS